MKAMTKNLKSAMFGLCLKDIKSNVGQDTLKGLNYVDGEIRACDSYVIAIIKADYPEEYEGKCVKRDGTITDMAEPMLSAWKVVPDIRTSNTTEIGSITELMEAVRNLPKAIEKFAFVHNGSYYKISQMRQLFKIFQALKEEPEIFQLENNSTEYDNARLVMRSESCLAAMILPVQPQGHEYFEHTFSLEELTACADLL